MAEYKPQAIFREIIIEKNHVSDANHSKVGPNLQPHKTY